MSNGGWIVIGQNKRRKAHEYTNDCLYYYSHGFYAVGVENKIVKRYGDKDNNETGVPALRDGA